MDNRSPGVPDIVYWERLRRAWIIMGAAEATVAAVLLVLLGLAAWGTIHFSGPVSVIAVAVTVTMAALLGGSAAPGYRKATRQVRDLRS